jgi:hypothetical protein
MSTNQTRRRRQQAAMARQAAERRRRERRRRLLAVAVAVGLVVAALAVFAVARGGGRPEAPAAPTGLQTGPAPWTADTAGLAGRLRAIGVPPLSPMEGAVVHIHQHLDLYVDGRKVTVPAGIGIDPEVGYAPLHTHDDSGVVHVESPTVRSYTLGQVFAVWGVRFTPSCLGGYCAGDGRQLQLYVNGTRYQGDPTTLVLAAHQELVVAFGTAAQLPSPVSSSYRFPAGE